VQAVHLLAQSVVFVARGARVSHITLEDDSLTP
jgi:hypothetical protein